MTGENARTNSQDEGKQGDEALAAAECLLENGFLRDAVSCAYYAAFHWARALLLLKGFEPKTHRGTVQLFSLHYVKNGPLTEDAANLLAHLETYRELSDYTSGTDFTREEAQKEISRARRFIEACRPVAE